MAIWGAALYLHGFGSDASTFGAWFNTANDSRPHIFLEGPEFDEFTSARRWFAFTANLERMTRRVQASAALAEADLLARLIALGLDVRVPLALVGHSQGAMVGLELIRRGSLNIVEARCYAGYHPAPTTWRGNVAPTAVSLYSSVRDGYIRMADVIATYQHLAKLPGMHVSHFVSIELDHRFGEEWLCPSRFKLRAASP